VQEVESQAGVIKVPICLINTDAPTTVELDFDEVNAVFTFLQRSVAKVEETIQEIESLDVLAVLDVVDVRKTVKDAYAKRANHLLASPIEPVNAGPAEGGE
jgi:hypothetical protein